MPMSKPTSMSMSMSDPFEPSRQPTRSSRPRLAFAPVVLGLAGAAVLALGCGSGASQNDPPGTGAGGTGAAGKSGAGGTSGTAGRSGEGSAAGQSGGGMPAPGGAGGGAMGGSGGQGMAGEGAAGTGGGAAGGAPGGADAGPTPPSAEETAALDQVCTPRFTLKLQDMGEKGQLFVDAVNGDAEAFVQKIGREVCRVLYRKPEEVRAANHIELNIRDYDGVAAKWGDVGDIGVEISTRHLQNVKNQGRDVAEEVAGILHHEMTHMYQNDDKPEATFPGMANMYEGIADAVRIRNGFVPAGAAPNDKNGSWEQKAYASQAFFWLFIDTAFPDFIYRLNATMKGKDGTPWQPESIEQITGKSADDWWAEYQDAACCRGSNRTCCK